MSPDIETKCRALQSIFDAHCSHPDSGACLPPIREALLQQTEERRAAMQAEEAIERESYRLKLFKGMADAHGHRGSLDDKLELYGTALNLGLAAASDCVEGRQSEGHDLELTPEEERIFREVEAHFGFKSGDPNTPPAIRRLIDQELQRRSQEED